MATLQVRDIDDRLYESLRKRATRDKRLKWTHVSRPLNEGLKLLYPSVQAAA